MQPTHPAHASHPPDAVRPAHPTRTTRRHPHDDAPDTAADFARLAVLPEGTERRELRDELVRVWLPMAHRIAGRYTGRGENAEDLRQVAAMGLVKAVDRYDPGHERAFEAYAVPTITGEVKRHFRDCLWAVHVPRRVQDLRNQVRRSRRELAQCSPGGGEPTVAEIAGHARLGESDVRTGLEALDCFSSLSTDATVSGTDSGSLTDVLGGSDQGYEAVVDRLAVGPYLRRLPERERTILYLRFFQGMTQSRIGEELGLSQMHISRLITRCCAQLRHEVMAEAA
ncbi:SigB/SigF/SigG family RNA polymerase sigma factor [Streptomyces sp. NPDC056716]|uniref:SigB/SigF/SigG family RNA polymerase sigma factor n=1 Tax=unclassified Streptomyces TaxID=2593676 RepID=UPI0036AACA0F